MKREREQVREPMIEPGNGDRDASDTLRVVLLALGVVLLVAALPLLFMSGVMGLMMGGGTATGMMGGLAVLVLVLGGAALTAGILRR